jgi:hypothetical protein
MAEAATVPVRIKNLTDADALEAQLLDLFLVPQKLSMTSTTMNS